MEQNYDLLAQSRANYYTVGSPIQFVRVELLKGEVNGEIAVCLTFKNISQYTVTGLVIRFKCKSAAGKLLCEDQFYYEDIAANQGDLFGSDDAVYISDEPVGSVEVTLDRAFLQDGSAHALTSYRKQRLPAPKLMPPQIARAMEQRMGKESLTVVPQVMSEGWYCACGAFHPNEEDSVYCSECGSDRIMLQNVLTSLLQGNRPMQKAELDPETALTEQQRFSSQYHQERGGEVPEDTLEKTRSVEMKPSTASSAQKEFVEDVFGEGPKPFDLAPNSYEEDEEEFSPHSSANRGRYAEPADSSADDEVAERIIRFAPAVTAVVCTLIVAAGVLVHFLG